MRTLPTALKKRPGLLLIWLVLLLAIPISLGASCTCNRGGEIALTDDVEKDMPKQPQPEITKPADEYEYAIKANFTGTSRNYGIGSCINGAPIYVNKGTVTASKQVAIDEQTEDGRDKGTETYKLEGTIDPETNTIEATITRTMDSISYALDGRVGVIHKYTATLTLTALKGDGTGWSGKAVGKETFLETTPTGNDFGGAVESDLNWDFQGSMIR